MPINREEPTPVQLEAMKELEALETHIREVLDRVCPYSAERTYAELFINTGIMWAGSSINQLSAPMVFDEKKFN